MLRVLLAVLAVVLIFGSISAFQFRERMSSARLGSDVTYSIDTQGNAAVEMSNKSYFIDAETEKNFDGQAARLGRPDVQAFQKGVEDSLQNISVGRPMSVSDFEASFERTKEYGAQVYRFEWSGFAQQSGANWVVDFRSAKPMKLTKDSSLVIVLPAGAKLVAAEPAPSSQEGSRLVWLPSGSGSSELAWPHVEYR